MPGAPLRDLFLGLCRRDRWLNRRRGWGLFANKFARATWTFSLFRSILKSDTYLSLQFQDRTI
jgi:hypothetical protein